MMRMYCNNCGHDMEASEAICPNCGTAAEGSAFEVPPLMPPPSGSGWKSLWTVLVVLLCIFIGLPSCLLGGCALVVAASGLGGAGNSARNALGGLAFLALFGALLYVMIRMVKGKS